MTGHVAEQSRADDKRHGANRPGLSTLHKRTQIIPAELVVHDEGGLAQVRREQEEKQCLKCGRPFRVLVRRSGDKNVCRSCETVLKECKACGRKWHGERWPHDEEGNAVKVYCPGCGAEYRGNKRDNITRFSENSRRRLMRLLATIRKGELPCFVTLTYPDSWDGHADPDAWKVTLKRFEARFRRAFPDGAYIWRQEVVDRKSGARVGELSPHFHLLVFGVKYAELRVWVPGAWYESVGTCDPAHLRAGTQVARINSRKGIMSYASKAIGATMSRELGKTVQTTAGRVGRWWGIAIRDNFQAVLSTVQEIKLEEAAAVRIMRAFRQLAKVRSRDYSSLTAFVDGAFLLFKLPHFSDPPPARAEYKASGRPGGLPFMVWAFQTGRLAG